MTPSERVTMKLLLCRALALTWLALPAAAADEDEALRRGLEGRFVVVDVDLPASERGLDLRFDKPEPFNQSEHVGRLRQYDVAIRRGDEVQVTRVRVKGDHVEFQLEGGGFDWASQATTRTFTSTPKSSREKDLDRLIKSESDRDRKRDLEDERNDLRRERERHDDRHRREIEEYNVLAHERDVERALRSGSRINLRFKKKVPPEALTPEGLLRWLEPWVRPADRNDRPRRD
jgi:hypothetical protein